MSEKMNGLRGGSAPLQTSTSYSEDSMNGKLKRMRHPRRERALLVAAVAGLACSAGHAHAESVIDWHTFKDTTAAPLAGQGTDDPMIGTLAQSGNNSFVIGYLGTPLALANEGDQISFSFGVRFNDLTQMSNAGDNFRF